MPREMDNCFIDKDHRAIADLVEAEEMGLGKGMIITRINVPKAYRGKGLGSSLLAQILAAADRTNTTLFLEIQPSDGLDHEQLRAWYLRHGFKETKYFGIYRRLPHA